MEIQTSAFGNSYFPIVGFPLAGKYKSGDIGWIDLSESNKDLMRLEKISRKTLDSNVQEQIEAQGAKIGIGGYGEYRTVYQKFKHFGGGGKNQRNYHLGIDIWAAEKTAVLAPLPGIVHSFADNDNKGDYGPTVILEHPLGNVVFYSLYGHLSKKSLQKLNPGTIVKRGSRIGSLGGPKENGGWPPHLHFQIINKLGKHHGDYPGVATDKEVAQYLKNCPNPLELFKPQWGKILPAEAQ